MQGAEKTKEELAAEVAQLRQRVAELEQSEIKRKQTEEALRKSEEKYRTVVDLSPDGIAVASKGRHVFANKSLAKILGVSSPDELVGKPVIDYIHPDYRKIVRERLEQQTKRGELVPLLEEKMLRADGTVIHAEATAAPLKYEGEQAVLAVIRDITERRRTEEALRNSQLMLQTVLDSIPVAVFWKDRDSRYLGGNRTWLKAAGMKSSEEVIGKSDYDLPWEKEQADSFREIDRRVMESGLAEHDFIEPYIKADGTRAWAKTNKVPLRDASGSVIGIMGTYEDITERKRAEEELRKSEERFRKVVETMKVGLATVDENGILTYVNEYSSGMIGYSEGEMVGHDPTDFYYDEEERKAQKEIFKKRKKGMRDAPTHEVAWRTKDGRKVYSILSPTPFFDAEGRFTGSFAIHTDITERKQMEQELQESEEKYRSLVESSEDSIYLVDQKCNYIFLNNKHLSRLGVKMKQIIGRPYATLHSPEESRDFAHKVKKVIKTGQSLSYEYRSQRDNRYFIRTLSPVTSSDGEVIEAITVISKDITERKEAEEKNLVHLRFMGSMDQFNRALQGTNDLDQMMSDALDLFLTIFDCERAWLLYPCEPEAASWRVPMERAKTGYPGVFAMGTEIPMDTGAAKMMQTALDSDAPVRYGPGMEYPLPEKEPKRFGIQSQLAMAIYPRVGKPWLFGLHQCSYVRVWTPQEEQLFQEIGHRLADSLTSLLVYRDLKERENQYRELANSITDVFFAMDTDLKYTYWNKASENLTGIKAEAAIGKTIFEVFPDTKETRKAAAVYQDVLKKKQPKSFDNEYRLKDKHYFFEINAYPTKDGISVFAKDIIERKEAEEKLREREAFNYALFKYNPVETIVVDREGKVTGFNLAKEQSGDRLPTLGDRMYKDYASKHEIDMRAELMRCIQSGESKRLSERKYGDKYLNITITPFAQGAIIISEDITERKQTEALLYKERDTFFSILEKAPSGVMVVDADDNFSFVNSEFTNITGYTLEDIPTRQEWRQRAYPDQSYRHMVQKTWEKDYARSKDQETFHKRYKRVFSRVFTVMCKDGAAKEIDFRATEMGDGGTIFMLSDITERQRMHDLLETSASEWRTTFDAINDAVCLLNPNGKIIRCNNTMLQIMGKPFSQITNHHCWEVIHGVSEAPNSCPIALVGKTHRRETEVMFKDLRWFRISVDPLLDEEGNIIGGVHIMSDITDRMRIQHELQDSREQLRNLTVYLQSVREQERTNIAREIHDELAQALTALKMDVSWIDHRLPSDVPSLSEKTKSMVKLIDSTIHTVKRISAELRPGVLDDLGLVAAIEWQAEEFQNRTGISCKITVDPQDLTVDQDRSTSIFRIFQETLTNVARHAHATRVSVSLKERGGKLTLRVRDNGTGITEEQIAAPQSFGLIGIRERVHPWGGKVSIKGMPGKGTTVTVNLEQADGKHDLEKIELKGSPS